MSYLTEAVTQVRKTEEAPRIQVSKVETIPIKIPIRHEDKLGIGSLKNIENVIVRIHCDENVEGIGESSPWPVFGGETQESVSIAIDKYLSPVVVGEDPFEIEKICEKMDKVIQGNSFAKAGIEMALFDIVGKILQVPVHKILGGLFQEKVPLSFSVANQDTQSDIEEITQLITKGIRNFKIKVAVLNPAQDIQRIAAIRKAFDDQIDLRADANQGWSRNTALSTIKKLEKFDLTYIEQPVPHWDIDGMAKIARAVDTPISADESVFSTYDAIEIIRKEAADIISIKLMKFGGFSKSKKVAAVAEAAGIPCYAGAMWESGIGMAAGLQFSGSTKNVKYGGDYYVPIFLMMEDVLTKPLRVKDSFIYVPKEPGLGVTLDEEKIHKYRVR